MAMTLDELESFRAFAAERLKNRDTGLTLEDCLREWRADRERAETIAGIQRGVADFEAARHASLEEVDQEIRRRFGFSDR